MEPQTSSPNQYQGGEEKPYRLRVLLEPRGITRVIEFFLAVLMFATTAGYSSIYYYTITCKGHSYTYDKEYPFGYPFNFTSFPVFCEATNTSTAPRTLDAHPGGSASFFVAIGVLAMLYSIVTLIWYVFLEVKFLKFDLIPAADFIMTIVFAVFFFLASCAWAAGVNSVKYWTDFDNIVKELFPAFCSTQLHVCTKGVTANYAALNVSIIFGFLNCFVWGANSWFTLKETTWFRNRQAQSASPDVEKEQPPNEV